MWGGQRTRVDIVGGSLLSHAALSHHHVTGGGWIMTDSLILCGQHYQKLPNPAMNWSLVGAKKVAVGDASVRKQLWNAQHYVAVMVIVQTNLELCRTYMLLNCLIHKFSSLSCVYYMQINVIIIMGLSLDYQLIMWIKTCFITTIIVQRQSKTIVHFVMEAPNMPPKVWIKTYFLTTIEFLGLILVHLDTRIKYIAGT